MIFEKLFFNLRIFDGAESSADGGSETVDSDNNSDVVLSDDGSELDPDAEFEELIKGKFKEQYSKRTQKMIDARYKKAKIAESENESLRSEKEKLSPILSMLQDRYQTDDYDSLLDLMSKDEDLISERAAELGMEPSAYLKYSSAMRQNEVYEAEKQKQAEAETERQREKLKADILRESEELKSIYPDFDLQKEYTTNPAFKALVSSDVPMKDAYEMVHYKEFGSKIAEHSYKKAKKDAAQDIAARGNRAKENGMGKGSPGVGEFSLNNLTDSQRADLRRRLDRGEEVTLVRAKELYS